MSRRKDWREAARALFEQEFATPSASGGRIRWCEGLAGMFPDLTDDITAGILLGMLQKRVTEGINIEFRVRPALSGAWWVHIHGQHREASAQYLGHAVALLLLDPTDD